MGIAGKNPVQAAVEKNPELVGTAYEALLRGDVNVTTVMFLRATLRALREIFTPEVANGLTWRSSREVTRRLIAKHIVFVTVEALTLPLKPSRTITLHDRAAKLFAFFEAVLPKRYTREEFGDALEQLAKLEALGASPWKCRILITKTIFWLSVNVARDAFMLLASLLRIFGH